jgi:type IV pilus assembly protein PilM
MSGPVSIEIGAQSVRVAQLVERRGRVRAVRFAEEGLPPGYRWEVGGDRQPVVHALGQALAVAGIRARTAVIVLPRGQVTARISAFPAAEHGDLRNVIEYDLADHVPFPVDQVVVDFQELGSSGEESGLVDVLVVAAPLELVREYLRVAEDAGLRVSAITVDALALDDLARMTGREPAGFGAEVEVGSRSTTINISEGERLRLTRSVAVGGNQLARAIQEDLGASAEEAEALKEREGLGLLAREPQPAGVRAWTNSLVGEIRRSALSFGPAGLSRIALFGPESGTPGLAEHLAAEFGVEPLRLSAADIFSGCELIGGDAVTADNCLVAMAAAAYAVGQSAWRVSLLPAEVAEAVRATRLRSAVAVSVAVLAIAMVLFYLLTARDVRRLEDEVGALRAQTQAAAVLRTEGERILSERREIEQQAEALKPIQIRRYTSLELLRTIALYSPTEIVLTDFILRPGQAFQLRGTAPDSAVVADLQHDLSLSPLVGEATLTGTDRVSGSARLRFAMEVRLWTQQAEASGGTLTPWGGSR